MPLSKKAWEDLLDEANSNVLCSAIEFIQEEAYLNQLESKEPNTSYPILATAVATLQHVWDQEPMETPKLDIVTFSFDEAPSHHVEIKPE